jgi:hypothetical protein
MLWVAFIFDTQRQIENYVYTPKMQDIVNYVILQCQKMPGKMPRKIVSIVGSQRSEVYRPGQAIMADSAFLPHDKFGMSKALILTDVCTSFSMIFPSADLKVQTIIKHIKNLLCCHTSPQCFISDFGNEFSIQLTEKLAELNISHKAGSPFNHNSSGQIESTVKIVKSALQCIVLSNLTDWSAHVPLLVTAVNNMLLYGTFSRNSHAVFPTSLKAF